MSVSCELGLYLCSQIGFNSALSPVVYGDIALSINTHYTTIVPVLSINVAVLLFVCFLCVCVLGN